MPNFHICIIYCLSPFLLVHLLFICCIFLGVFYFFFTCFISCSMSWFFWFCLVISWFCLVLLFFCLIPWFFGWFWLVSSICLVLNCWVCMLLLCVSLFSFLVVSFSVFLSLFHFLFHILSYHVLLGVSSISLVFNCWVCMLLWYDFGFSPRKYIMVIFPPPTEADTLKTLKLGPSSC